MSDPMRCLGAYYPDPVAGQALTVRIPAADVLLDGDFVIPAKTCGVVLFAHGTGSSRRSRRNRYVAYVLNQIGLATLLFDLLTEREESVDIRTAELRFDIPFLAKRLLQVTDWLLLQPQIGRLRIGYFGASTGAAAALVAAADPPQCLGAVVSRGGRPDLAGESLTGVDVPTLLIVGGSDLPVLDWNRQAMEELRCEKRLEIIPGATHLFEEPGALESVARLAREWFEVHLSWSHDFHKRAG
jgi:putative phosphoribosyl transferase